MTQPIYIGGQSTNVTVRVRNTSPLTHDYVIDYDFNTKPLLWTVTPSSHNPLIPPNSEVDLEFTVTPNSNGGDGSITWRFKDDGLISNPVLDSRTVAVSASAFPDVRFFDSALYGPSRVIADKNFLPQLSSFRFDDLGDGAEGTSTFTSNESRCFAEGDTAVISAQIINDGPSASEITIEAWYNDTVSVVGMTSIGELATARTIQPSTVEKLGLEWVPPAGRHYIYIELRARVDGTWHEIDAGWVGDGDTEEYMEVNSNSPVVLVHGWGGSDSTFGNLEIMIESMLHRAVRHFEYDTAVTALAFDSPRIAREHNEFDSLSDQLNDFLNNPEGQAGDGAPEILHADAIAHSMGGLVARYYASEYSDRDTESKFGRIVTLGTPHYGGNLADIPVIELALNNQAEDFEFGSELIWELDRAWRDEFARLPELLAVVGTDDCGLGNYNDSDGVVRASSASLEGLGFPVYYVPRKHSSIIPCALGSGVANVDGPFHPSWLPIERFLAGDSFPFSGAPGNSEGMDNVGRDSHPNTLDSAMVYVVAPRTGPDDLITVNPSDVRWDKHPLDFLLRWTHESSGIHYFIGRTAADEVNASGERYTDYLVEIEPDSLPTRESAFRLKAGETHVVVADYDPCGDGLVVGFETCDDGGLLDGDGCSSACRVEQGFSCSSQPSQCEAICGDGLVLGSETCDDGLSPSASCCSASCQIQPAAVECRTAVGECDAGESCDGTSPLCPADQFQSSEVECRSVTGQCDQAEMCLGTGPECPADSAAPNGILCSDGNACTQLDTCQGGSCAGMDPISCTALDQCHTRGICDPSAGTCSNPISLNGTTCNDGDRCTQVDTCQGGICEGDDPVECTALDQCHKVGECDIGTGICSNPLKSNGVICEDDDFCNGLDTCNEGTCSPGDDDPCLYLDCPATCDEVTNSCRCAAEYCGDGIVQPDRDEECDDGNARSDDECTELCQVSVCGDGILHPDEEECDDGNRVGGDGCSPSCGDEFCTGLVRRIGDNEGRLGLDRDIFEISGVAGESVALTLAAIPGGTGDTATLVLVDDQGGDIVYISESGDLPVEITGELLETGRYLIVVRAHSYFSEDHAFRGNYCIELESTGDAGETLGDTR